VSIDLEIWSVLPTRTIDTLPKASSWVALASGWAYRQKTWQLVIDEATEVDPEDVPPEIGPRIVGIHFCTRLSVEGHAPRAAVTLQRAVARVIAKNCRGLVFDPQNNQVFGASTQPRPALTVEGESIELLTMSWWFASGPLTTREGLNELILYFERHIPPFLPRRYGEYEPAKFRFDRSNLTHFADTIFNARLVFVWDTGSPLSVSYSPTNGPGWRWAPGLGDDAFQLPSLELKCPLTYLDDPGWSVALKNAWEAISKLAQPIYGDVRILSGWIRRGRRLWANSKTESHPIRVWRGLPRKLGLAVAIGEPYLSQWPEMKRHAIDDTLAMVSISDWRSRGEISDLVGNPPAELCQPESGLLAVAHVWPFPAKPERVDRFIRDAQ
jgi:hypothetical protein